MEHKLTVGSWKCPDDQVVVSVTHSPQATYITTIFKPVTNQGTFTVNLDTPVRPTKPGE